MSRASELRKELKAATRKVASLELELSNAREDLTTVQGELAEAERAEEAKPKESLL